jgi:hypothetical protein
VGLSDDVKEEDRLQTQLPLGSLLTGLHDDWGSWVDAVLHSEMTLRKYLAALLEI